MSRLARLVAAAALGAAALALPRSGAAQSRAVDVRQNLTVISAVGSKCLDVEWGGSGNGTRIIGYPCAGNFNQQFWFNANGTIQHAGKCVVVQGGQGRDGDGIVLWDCNGGANEQWRWENGRLVGQNGRCLELEGGDDGNRFLQNQRTILRSCTGSRGQSWTWGLTVARSKVPNANVVQPGRLAPMSPIDGMARVIAAGGGNVVAAGGGNVIAAGGGNVIAPGGGN